MRERERNRETYRLSNRRALRNAGVGDERERKKTKERERGKTTIEQKRETCILTERGALRKAGLGDAVTLYVFFVDFCAVTIIELSLPLPLSLPCARPGDDMFAPRCGLSMCCNGLFDVEAPSILSFEILGDLKGGCLEMLDFRGRCLKMLAFGADSSGCVSAGAMLDS